MEIVSCVYIQFNILSCLVLVEVFEFMKLADEFDFDLKHSIIKFGALSSSHDCFKLFGCSLLL
jgi:hypothetical protein